MAETDFSDTQVGADGRRYHRDDIEKVNEQVAKGEAPKPLSYVPAGEEAVAQTGSGVPTGIAGEDLSPDRSSAPAVAAQSAATVGKPESEPEHKAPAHKAPKDAAKD